MSCPSSVPALRPAHDPAALAEALIRVAERSLFAYAELAATDQVLVTASGWYEASVSFTGPFSGCVRVALPVGLARDLWASFLGLEPDVAVDEVAVCDLVGELANMAAGSWLTGRGETSCFDLTHPEVRQVAAPPAADAVVSVNDQPVAIVLRVAPGEP
jgi:chemotaxis phosphatase CheX-like protein